MMFLAFLMFLQAYEGNIRDAVGPFVPIRNFSIWAEKQPRVEGPVCLPKHQKDHKHQKARA
jgi:hypothetical protein